MFSKALALVSVTLVGGAIAVVGCSSSSSGTGATGDDTTPDSGPAVDAKADHVTTGGDAQQTFDTGPTPDTGTTATCAVQPLPDGGTFPPPLTMSKGTTCGAGVTSAVIAACFGSGTTTTCAAYEPGGSASPQDQECAACVLGASDGSTLGVGAPAAATGYAFPDTWGCVNDVDTSAAGQACGTALWNLYVCENTACQSCTATTDTTGMGVSSCFQTADTGVCATYVTAVDNACASELVADGGASACVTTQSEDITAIFTQYGVAMCGGS